MKSYRRGFFICLLTAGVLAVTSLTGFSEESVGELRQQIEDLQERIAELEKQLAENENQAKQYRQLPLTRRGWDPFTELEEMQKQMNRMFSDSFSRGRGFFGEDPLRKQVLFDPQVDISETATHYLYRMDLPGMKKSQINVEVKNGMLIVAGERSSDIQETAPNNFMRRERNFGSFSRSLSLPEDAKSDDITAEYKNGVLTVKVGRTQTGGKRPEPPKRITIQ